MTWPDNWNVEALGNIGCAGTRPVAEKGCGILRVITKPHTMALGCQVQRSGLSANIIVHDELRHTRAHYHLDKCDHSSLHVKWTILSIHMPNLIQFKFELHNLVDLISLFPMILVSCHLVQY